MLTLKNLRSLFGGRGGSKSDDAERLDVFLADPALVRSLREDDLRRKRLSLVLGSLLIGLLLGAGGMLLGLYLWKPVIFQSGASTAMMARLLASQAQTAWRAKELDQAVSHAQLAVELAPNLVDGWDALALSLFYSGQTAEAEKAAQKCLKIDPGYTRADLLLGDFSFYTGDWKQAETYWRKAPDAKRSLAGLLLLENRFEEAIPRVRELARDRPDDPMVRVMREAVQIGRLTPEVQRKLAPDFVASRSPDTAKAWDLFWDGRYEEASAAFSRALSKSPRDGSAIIGRGWCLLQIGSPREAQSAFDQALAFWPSSYSALNGRAWTNKALGQTEGAEAIWRQLVTDFPRSEEMEIPSCYKGLGTLHYERGDYAGASYYLVRARLGDPFDREITSLLRSSLDRQPAP